MMTSREFAGLRKKIGKSQRDMARLLGLSIKAVHSYEQGWRKIPGSVERQVFFLYSRHRDTHRRPIVCWSVKNCPPDQKLHCPAWEFRCGHLCWFISGTFCQGIAQKSWKDKIKICRNCEVFQPLFEGALETVGDDGPQRQSQTDKNRQPHEE
jgi:hypothetical protein